MLQQLWLLLALPIFIFIEMRSDIQMQKTITFKKLTDDDIPLLVQWFSFPHVHKWWPILEKNEVIDHFLKRIRSQDTFGFIVYYNDKPIGYIQYYYIDPKRGENGKVFTTPSC